MVRALDPTDRIAVLPLRHHLAESLLPQADRVDSIHFVDAAGRVSSAGDALLEVAAHLPGGTLIAPTRHLPPARWLWRIGYRALAERRGRMSRWMPDLPPTVFPPETEDDA